MVRKKAGRGRGSGGGAVAVCASIMRPLCAKQRNNRQTSREFLRSVFSGLRGGGGGEGLTGRQGTGNKNREGTINGFFRPLKRAWGEVPAQVPRLTPGATFCGPLKRAGGRESGGSAGRARADGGMRHRRNPYLQGVLEWYAWRHRTCGRWS